MSKRKTAKRYASDSAATIETQVNDDIERSAFATKNVTVKATKVQCGNIAKMLTKDCTDMIDSTALYASGDSATLYKRLERDGYLFVRGAIPLELALGARRAVLRQALADGSVMGSRDGYVDGRMARVTTTGKKAKHWAPGYCVDVTTGAETNQRVGIDEEAWTEVTQSAELRAVYNGEALFTFWGNIFGDGVSSLVTEAFIRLIGVSATQEHSDYYYFKKDTEVFRSHSGRQVIAAAKTRGCDSTIEVLPTIADMLQAKAKRVPMCVMKRAKVPESRQCGICERSFRATDIGAIVWQRASVGDFGTSGDWHCPTCASSDFAVYTTWISLSELAMPSDSVLCVCPGSHRLRQWDMPCYRKQLPGDFVAKLSRWVVPYSLRPGDAVLFNIKTVHGSTFNNSSPCQFRVSCDTRMQLHSVDALEDDEKQQNMK